MTRRWRGTLGLIVIVSTLCATRAAASGPDGRGSLAEITLPAPAPYAILLKQSDKSRLLVSAGDALTDPRESSRLITVEQVQPSSLTLRATSDSAETVRPGRPISSLPGYVFARAVMLSRLQLWHRTVDRVRQLAPALVALDGAEAAVEIEVPPRAATLVAVATAPAAAPAPQPLEAPTRLSETLLTRVKVRELSGDKYEVGRSELRAALENAGAVLADLRPSVLPSLSLSGIEYKISSAASDGVLGTEGFTVYSPKLASRAGIEVGDRILKVNERVVEGLASLYKIYQDLRANASATTVQVEIERAGARQVKTFKIR